MVVGETHHFRQLPNVIQLKEADPPTFDRETLRVPHTTPGLRDGSPVGVTTQPKLLKPGRMMKG